MGRSSGSCELNHKIYEVKVPTIFYLRIKHSSFKKNHSLCIGDNHGTVLEYVKMK